MTPEERAMISGLFDRMRGVGPVAKDAEAEALIVNSIRQQPDAGYMLVQSVLVQEHALQQAGARIEDLEARMRELEAQAARPAPQQGSSFLGGLFGGGSAQSSVPATGRQSAGFGHGAPRQAVQAARPGSPWGQAAQPGMAAPMQQQPAAGGGFLKSAMATAAGVAGGMLLANSISGMLGGSSGAATAQTASTDAASTHTSSAASDQADYSSDVDNAADVQDAGYDDGGGFDMGGDMDI